MIEIDKAYALDSHSILIEFNDGTARVIDFVEYFDMPAMKSILDANDFEDFSVTRRSLGWPKHRVDFCADSLSHDGVPIAAKVIGDV